MRLRYVSVLLGLALLGLFAAAASGQVLQGTVVDDGGRVLVGASVAVVGSDRSGTTTDENGRFRLRLGALPATVEVRFLGFVPIRLVVERGSPLKRTIRLAPRTLELGEIDVDGENRAISLMREVIRRKQRLRTHLPAYTTEHYTRLTLRRRGEVVRVEEVLSDAYVRPGSTAIEGAVQGRAVPGRARREVVLARQRRPDGAAFRYASVQAVPDFYLDDEVILDGFRYIGPTHPDALQVYDFRVGERSVEAGRVYWDVTVRPRSPLATALEGRLRVVDSLFVLAEVELRPSQTLEKAPPVESWSASYAQSFAPASLAPPPLADSVWVPDRFDVRGRVDVGVPGAYLPTVRFAQATVVLNRRLGADGSDSLFASSAPYVEPASVYTGPGMYTRGRSLAPLDDDEAAALLQVSPPLSASLVPKGLLRNYVPLPVEAEADDQSPGDALASPRPRLLQSLEGWYNRVQGAYVGLQPTVGIGEDVALRPRLGLATSNVRIDAGLQIDVRLPVRVGAGRIVGEVEGGIATRPFESSDVYPQALLSVPTYIGWPDYHDYLRTTSLRGGLLWSGDLLRMGVSVDTARNQALRNATDYEGMFVGDGQRPNARAEEGVWSAVRATAAVGAPRRWLARPRSFHLGATVEAGRFDASVGRSTAVYRATTHASGRVATLFRRRPEPAALYVQATASWTSQEAPVQLHSRPETRAGGLSGFGAFRTQAAPPLPTDRFVQLTWEHDFGRSLFELVGVSVSLALTGGHLWTEEHGGHEVGVSLVRPWGFPVRIDSAWRLDAPGWFIGLGLAR